MRSLKGFFVWLRRFVDRHRGGVTTLVVFTVGPLALFLLFQLAFYGSLSGALKGCAYREKILVPPEALVGSIIVLESDDMYVAKGSGLDRCSPILASIPNEMVPGDLFRYSTIDKGDFEERGSVLELLPKGKVFTFEKLIKETKHGLSAVDSGGGPFFIIVMKDEQGAEYVLNDVHMDVWNVPDDQAYFGYYKNGVRVNALYSECFRIAYEERYVQREAYSFEHGHRTSPVLSCWPGNIPSVLEPFVQ